MERAAALLVGGAVQQDFRQVRHQRDLDRVEHGGLAAPVVAEQETAPADRQELVEEVVPLHQPDSFEAPHPVLSSSSAPSASTSGSDTVDLSVPRGVI